MENESKKLKVAAENATHHLGSEKLFIPDQELEDMNEVLTTLLENVLNFAPDSALSDAERRRLLGSGVRRYGFIDKVADVAEDNPEFVPPFLDLETLERLLRDIENLRNLLVTLRQLLRVYSDLLLLTSDEGFRLALMYYNSVRDATRRRVPGAQAIFQTLQLFFRRQKPTPEEPTEVEVERDVKALLHGKKDGKIVIENETPHVVRKGKHVVVDETYKNKANFRERESGEMTES